MKLLIYALMALQIFLFGYGVYLITTADNSYLLGIGFFNVVINSVFFFVNISSLRTIKQTEEIEKQTMDNFRRMYDEHYKNNKDFEN